VQNKIAGLWLQVRSPTRTLHQLGICLRDLHREVREILPIQEMAWHSMISNKPPNDEINETYGRAHEGFERLQILLIAGFTLLRPLADELVNASRPFLLEHWKSAPMLMAKAKKMSYEGKLSDLKPICDLNLLNDALRNHTRWFEDLRQEDGLRD